MATNQITIVLEDCEPIGGYYVFYRPVGNVDPHRFAGIFFTSPIIFTDELDPVNQQYEGYVQSHCGGGIFGDPIPWETEGSPSVPGGSEPEPEECCDPVVLTADTETTIPDGSLPGSGSEPEVCCTPVVLNACIETLDESGSGSISGSESESESGSESEPEPPFGIVQEFTPGSYATYAALTLSDWNTNYLTAINADTPFDDIEYIPGEFKIVLKGATNLEMENIWSFNPDIVGFWDNSGSVTASDVSTFINTVNLEVVEMNFCLSFGASIFEACPALVSFSAINATTFGGAVFQDCTAIENIILPAATSVGASCFRRCTALVIVDLPLVTTMGAFSFAEIAGPGTIEINTPVLSPYGATAGDDNIFFSTTGQTIEITLLTAETGDGDIVTAQANNTVILIPV